MGNYHNCAVCGTETMFDTTCSRCWELGSRIEREPKLARLFLEAVESGKSYETVRFDPETKRRGLVGDGGASAYPESDDIEQCAHCYEPHDTLCDQCSAPVCLNCADCGDQTLCPECV